MMSILRAQWFLEQRASGLKVIEVDADTSTVGAAAAALGVEPGQIAKTLAIGAGERRLLLVARGNARLDNAAFRRRFGTKPRMLSAEQTEELTGQPIGGVGPFGHDDRLEIYCDESLLEFEIVYPSGGTRSSAVRIGPIELAALVGAQWVNVCRDPSASAGQ